MLIEHALPLTLRTSRELVSAKTNAWLLLQGMSSDLARLDDGVHNSCVGGACPERASPIATDHTDLLAYWKFDEGQGYVVHDVT